MARIDRIIRDLESKLDGVRAQKTYGLSTAEKARLATSFTAQIPARSRARGSSAFSAVWADAERRLTAELTAARALQGDTVQDKANRKIARRAGR